ncbi:MAG: hypothetical protein ABI883_04370 [Chthoniobacterales bacterium]
MNGPAEVKQEGESVFREIMPTSLLGVGALLRTRTGGTLQVTFLPSALAGLSEETELQIDELTLTKDGNETGNDVRSSIVRLRLLRGTMHALLVRLGAAPSDLTIKTPHGAVIAGSDCFFFLNVDDRRTRITCIQGRVITRFERSDYTVEAGSFQEFPSSHLSPRAAEEDAQAQREVTTDADHALQSLAGHQRLLRRPEFLDR